MLPTMLRFFGHAVTELTNQKQELPVVAMFVNETGRTGSAH
jgi:hypothetical protein